MTSAAADLPEDRPKDAVASVSGPKDAVASVSGHVSVLTTGDHALLRRMYLTNRPAADGVVVKLLLYAGLQRHQYEYDYPAWRLLVHVATLLSGTGKAQPHDSRRPLGTALHKAGFSENRLLRMTAARGEPLRDQVVLAGRMLARAGDGAVNLWTLLGLVGRDAERAQRARIRIAQDYYAAVARSEGDSK